MHFQFGLLIWSLKWQCNEIKDMMHVVSAVGLREPFGARCRGCIGVRLITEKYTTNKNGNKFGNTLLHILYDIIQLIQKVINFKGYDT
jgi:hypothetical protein